MARAGPENDHSAVIVGTHGFKPARVGGGKPCLVANRNTGRFETCPYLARLFPLAEVLEVRGGGGGAEFTEGFVLDLADTFAG